MGSEPREEIDGSDDALPPADPADAVCGLAFPAFATALKDALRDYHRPDLLARNPLLRQGFGKRDGVAGASALQSLLAETARTLFDNPRDEKKRRVIELTYFEPAAKQEAVANRLSLPFGTYRRHLTAARDRLTQWLWDRAAGMPVDAAPPSAAEATESHRLSLVVLPFLNIGGGAPYDHLVWGITETLTTDLSRRSCAFIVSGNTALTDPQHPVDVREVGRALRVRYALEGSVQTSDQRIRVNAQLIDARTGAHVWADRFDKPHADLLDIQDEIVGRIGRGVLIGLVAFEARRVADKPFDQRDAEDHTLCGWAIWNHRLSRAAAREAAACFETALRLDPDDPGALIGLASCLMWEVNMYGSDNRAEQIRAAEAAATRALDLVPNDAEAHVTYATVLFAMRLPERALRTLELAVRLDGHDAGAHAYLGLIKFFLGRADETRGHVMTAMRLSPRDPLLFHWLFFIGVADLYLGRRVRALDNLRKSVEINPNWALSQFILAGGLALAGLLAEAAEVCAVARRLAPNFTIAKFRGEVVSDSPIYLAQREMMYEGLRLAGVPEH